VFCETPSLIERTLCEEELDLLFKWPALVLPGARDPACKFLQFGMCGSVRACLVAELSGLVDIIRCERGFCENDQNVGSRGAFQRR
jgi:hypothetical protein